MFLLLLLFVVKPSFVTESVKVMSIPSFRMLSIRKIHIYKWVAL